MQFSKTFPFYGIIINISNYVVAEVLSNDSNPYREPANPVEITKVNEINKSD